MTSDPMQTTALPARAGLILPFVLITLLVVLAISGGLQTMAWRATRGARSQFEAQRATFAARAAIDHALSTWDAESLAQQPIGKPVTRVTTDAAGWQTELTLMRTGTLVASATATTTRTTSLALHDPTRVSRHVMTAVRLVPPNIPILAATTILGSAELADATLDGRDRLFVTLPPIDDCGITRDTASLAAVGVGGTTGVNAPIVYGAQITVLSPLLQFARDQFDEGWTELASRGAVQTINTPTTLTSLVPWRALVMNGATPVTLTGTSSHIGLLIVDGDLDIQGSLTVDGALVVRGALTVHGGPLVVRGALIVRDINTLGSRLNSATHVQYAPCILGRALSAVATPTFAPFLIWNSP